MTPTEEDIATEEVKPIEERGILPKLFEKGHIAVLDEHDDCT